MIVEEGKNGLSVTEKNLAGLMDEPPIKEDDEKREAECGVVNGLAWTSLGGEVLTVETAVLEGGGKLELTGKMGEVMKESAQIALSVVRSHGIDGCDAKFYKEHDLHIHIPAGAVPKDGPSAGVTLATAMYSALSGKKVRSDVAMTGELSLRGRVLPIGGLKEKLLAARQRGIFEVLVPQMNRLDVEKLPEHVTEGMNVLYMSHIDEVLKQAIVE
jgi:ATP-dependent Lon protease